MRNFQEFIGEGFIDDFKKRFTERPNVPPYVPLKFWIKFNSSGRKFKFSKKEQMQNPKRCYVSMFGLLNSNGLPEASFCGDSISTHKPTNEKSKLLLIGKRNFSKKEEFRITYDSDCRKSVYGSRYSNLDIDVSPKNCDEIVDFREEFRMLKVLSDKNELCVGNPVYIKKSDKVEIILEVIDFCLLGLKRGGIRFGYTTIDAHDGYEAYLTLYYRTQNGVYSTFEIDPMPKSSIKDVKISGIDILAQGLIDLKDEGKLDFKYYIENGPQGEYFRCVVDFVRLDTNLFIEFSKDFEVMCNRLEDMGYKVSMLTVNMVQMSFTVKNKN